MYQLYFSLDLHHEVEELRSRLADNTEAAQQMQVEFAESQQQATTEIVRLKEEIAKLHDRHDRYRSSLLSTKLRLSLGFNYTILPGYSIRTKSWPRSTKTWKKSYSEW